MIAAGAVLALALGSLCCGGSDGREAVSVFSASSTIDALGEAAAMFEAERGVEVRCSFASSSVLARQIDEGADPDIFLSANPKWMDFLQEKGLILAGSRRDLLANRLVLAAPAGEAGRIEFTPEFPFADAFAGRLALGDPDHVPAGIYAREALEHYRWYEGVADRLAPAMSVRAALRLIEIGAADLGIVYATDAAASDRVETVGIFPEESHSPILYPVAFHREPGPAALAFMEFLTSPKAVEIFARHGFASPPDPESGKP